MSNYKFFIFLFCLIFFTPTISSESREVTQSEINLQNAEYKTIQIRFATVDDVDNYNIYY